ncbi:MAG TPA: WYL domain-containing protein [Nocardioidaceae bacterium]|nr:WYL domain-containing protein [Nocardioidaceae bacterium]
MAGKRGRDQREPMERLVRMAAVLRLAGDAGVSGDRLAELAGFEGEARGDQVSRELRHLARQGWQIDNIAPEGSGARYRMRSVDNRLRVRLTPAQQRELQRAVLLVNRQDLVKRLGLEGDAAADVSASLPEGVHDETLATVLRAVQRRALLRYRYGGTDRVVHPQSVTTQNGKWYLRGREDGSSIVKNFVVGRMSSVESDEPGTATRDPEAAHETLHPMSWRLDPPVEVVLRAAPEYQLDVVRSLGTPVSVSDDLLTYVVTNRSALRTRLYDLGERVSIVSPSSVRDELIADLERFA